MDIHCICNLLSKRMKKILLILICLFVSLEVKSEDYKFELSCELGLAKVCLSSDSEFECSEKIYKKPNLVFADYDKEDYSGTIIISKENEFLDFNTTITSLILHQIILEKSLKTDVLYLLQGFTSREYGEENKNTKITIIVDRYSLKTSISIARTKLNSSVDYKYQCNKIKRKI